MRFVGRYGEFNLVELVSGLGVRSIFDINQACYSQTEIVKYYSGLKLLYPGEACQLDAMSDVLLKARVLDIGIGAGRTTLHIKDRCLQYIGVEYSKKLIVIAKRRFPALDLREMDARDLSAFKDDSFDVALFSYNGIDSLDHSDRMRVLREVHRVLQPGGLFAFSSHNRQAVVTQALQPKNIRASYKPISGALADYILGIFRWVCRRDFQTSRAEYAILNDNAHNYQLLTYYISPGRQRAQLERCGFDLVSCLGVDGKPALEDRARRDPWIFYTARKRVRTIAMKTAEEPKPNSGRQYQKQRQSD